MEKKGINRMTTSKKREAGISSEEEGERRRREGEKKEKFQSYIHIPSSPTYHMYLITNSLSCPSCHDHVPVCIALCTHLSHTMCVAGEREREERGERKRREEEERGRL